MSLKLSDPLGPVLGLRSAKLLEAQLELRTVGDLLRHFPRRYERYGQLTTIADLPDGVEVSLVAEVVSAELVEMRQRKGYLLKVVVTDGEDRLPMTFFQGWRLKSAFSVGRRMLFSGTVSMFRNQRQLTHPKWTPLETDGFTEADAQRPIPVYPATAKVAQHQIRTSVGMVLDILAPVDDPLPESVRQRMRLMELGDALRVVHRPSTDAAGYSALRRFIYEEAFVLQVALARRRHEAAQFPATPRPAVQGGILDAFDISLPFTLTEGQMQVGRQISDDLARSHPMHRLLQGEVGSGKTLVALRAMLTVVDTGGQAALLAPTEVLAAQHFRSISAMLGDIGQGGLFGGDTSTRVVLLTGSMPTAARRAALLQIASGEAGIVIGTHALLQRQVSFADLALVVVDEQHRFGVEQRDMLRDKGRQTPHLLVMTATPIPRTVAMTVFGDLETSVLLEVPAGRSEVVTHVVDLATNPDWYQRIWFRLREEVENGHQAYVVCPRIEVGEDDGPLRPEDAPAGDGLFPEEEEAPQRPLRAVLEVVEELRATAALSGLRIEALHGRMPAEERELVMRDFAAGAVHVLVATTVIEVGVDVANATAMVVLEADRFGMSQLHQLRGRVGRGVAKGVCLLVTDSRQGTPARTRVEVVSLTPDGFALARADLDLRREGDVLGAAQSGSKSSLRKLRVLRDEDTIIDARREATALVAADPGLVHHPALAQALEELLDDEREAYLDRT
ncbi:MAG: ATP-dependent DNA helicase RecG [Kineosporiaceae bacterium]|nr:ATP-dependent DNA helicase RecG [Kineosporiaceae bacterium]MBK7625394.1 ATP-dependent DNA helicase RecG [Kineosporiaceae bacterium]